MDNGQNIRTASAANENVTSHTRRARRNQPFGFGPKCANSLSIGYVILWGAFFFGIVNELLFISFFIVDTLIEDAFRPPDMGRILLHYIVLIPVVLFQVLVWIIVLARVQNLQKPVPVSLREEDQSQGDNHE